MCRCSFVVLFLFLLTATALPQGGASKELQLFQGSWQAIALQQADGRMASEDEVRSTSLVVEGNTFTLLAKDLSIRGTFSVDPSKTPRTIDVLLPANGQQTLLLGIYRIEGDIRQSCFALPGKERPRDFAPKQGHIGFQWKRK